MRLEDFINSKRRAEHTQEIREAQKFLRETVDQTSKEEPIVSADFARQLYRFMQDSPNIFSQEEMMNAAHLAAKAYRKIHRPLAAANYEFLAEEHEENALKNDLLNPFSRTQYPILDPNPKPI